MICGAECLAATGLGEFREPVFVPVLVVDEIAGGVAGICWLIEIDSVFLDTTEELY